MTELPGCSHAGLVAKALSDESSAKSRSGGMEIVPVATSMRSICGGMVGTADFA
jgi:hypothetical protein